jgi:thiol:disulfide interchange protein DsbD
MVQPKWPCLLAVFAALLAPACAVALSGAAVVTDNVTARLVAENRGAVAGKSLWVALEFDIRDGWHTYWRNPGDSGQATQLTWSLPPGWKAGDIVWTAPERFELPPLVNYGYAKHAVHLVELTAPPDLPAGRPVHLAARATWLVCADLCIPGSADLVLDLPVAASAAAAGADPDAAALFAAARGALARRAPGAVTAVGRGDSLVLVLGADWGAALGQIRSLAFFPYAEGAIDYAAPQTMTRSAERVELALKPGYKPPQDGPLRGLLLVGQAPPAGPIPLEVAAPFNAGGLHAAAKPRFAAAPSPAAASASPAAAKPGLAGLLLLAVLGGLVLNLMPCVFPVLSIKAIGLVEQAKRHPAAVRAKGVVFAAGVLASMLTLAGVLLALRAGGEQIGWGFQLQSPVFVTGMVYLLLAVGLNLSGVFEVGGGLADFGDLLTRGVSYRASFFTGVLTTLVATPCTAPFMAAAVGAALTQSPLVALLIFAALGLGLALPYLTLSFAPWLRQMLPKPGAWMETLKQVFAFPMYGSAAWLLWVLAQQTSPAGLGAALAGAILVGFAAWAYQKSKTGTRIGRILALATASVALVFALLLPLELAGAPTAQAGVAAASGDDAADGWQPFDPARAAALAAAGTPLLINFTASWCLTCLVNERNAFADPTVRQIFRGKGVALMKGDWTNRDPAITAALGSFGRAGVPLYVAYNTQPGSGAPVILPQLLTADIVRSAFSGLPNR